ncbi:DUF302 domain-containing protein [Leptospirillum ferrooxidans]|uniref:DUF302 domain-containing protein n=1 Tax=Leptospirillum ferrooxidans (strain C2-3) TaxID=1162668 RepID=I0IKL1_LEPFC|nr:DUF302 domain-containing protein [Leptospirillum ferrooxidans]BAM05810.1 hypothetical protein LFE_0081 [Leptospirillum ferrooxidans C2-3]
MKIFSRMLVPAIVVFLAMGFSGLSKASAAESRLVSVTTHGSFNQTVSMFKKLVAKNGMMVLGMLNQGKVMGMTGLKLRSETFFVGNPTMGKKLFSAQKGVGVLIPVRVNIYVNNDGKTIVSYLLPSKELGAFHDPMLVKMGMMLDKNLAMMTGMLK